SVSSPGMPKTCSTPSASRHSTTSSAAVRATSSSLRIGVHRVKHARKREIGRKRDCANNSAHLDWRQTQMSLALLILRLVLGLTFSAHGAQKLFGIFGGSGLDGTAQMFEKLGLRPAWLHARIAGTFEFAGGPLLALG